MSLKIERFSTDGALIEPDDAGFILRRLGEGAVSFAGVSEVSQGFWDALLGADAPPGLLERLERATMAPEVASSLARWEERQAPLELPVGSGAVLTAMFEPSGGLYTPTRLYSALRGSLRAYIESAWPLKHPALVRARRALLDEAEGGHLLAQEPFIETTPRYPQASGGWSTFALPSPVGEFLSRAAETVGDPEVDPEERLLYPVPYVHQQAAAEAFLGRGRELIVATGTGSGKTECFLVPMLGQLVLEAAHRPASYARPGVRALVLYPMNALVNDQLARLRRLLGSPGMRGLFGELGARHPYFGMYTGRTPYLGKRNASKDAGAVGSLVKHYLELERTTPERRALARELRKRGRYPAKDLVAFYGEALAVQGLDKNRKPKTSHNWAKRLRTGPQDSELLTRHEMIRDAETRQGRAPDVLVTNYSMLEYMLMRPFERPLFDETRAWLEADPANSFLLVVDEAHMYRGAAGAEVAFLLRRLRARLGLNEQPERLRVICTSASLGSGAAALEQVRDFAADLTGRLREDFEVVTSRREVPEPQAPASAALAEALASASLEAIHEADDGPALAAALAGVFAAQGAPAPESETREGVVKALFEALSGEPALNLALRETSGEAVALSALGPRLFPTLEGAAATRAAEALLTLGTLARPKEGAPGLLPTRLHMMFRGIHGLYACINPRCEGMAHHADGQASPVGKLFAEPRSHCDACFSRVFELLSCRNCGTAFLQAAVPVEKLQTRQSEYLWGAGQQIANLEALELLPYEPGSQSSEQDRITSRRRVEMISGFLLGEEVLAGRSRDVLLPRALKDGAPVGVFPCCPECQDPSTSERRRINSFRTLGEQAFTALIEAQFMEQAPQPAPRDGEAPPNRGRKVLVFSDGRQKAARLAPALQHSHARDAFRQALVLAVRELEGLGVSASLRNLYPAVLWVEQQRSMDLFPEASDDGDLGSHRARIKPPGGSLLPLREVLERYVWSGFIVLTAPYARRLFDEVCDRFYSLWALGLGRLDVVEVLRGEVVGSLPAGLPEEVRGLILRQWIRTHLERRSLMLPNFNARSLYTERELSPRGIAPHKPGQVVPPRFGRWLEQVIEGAAEREATIQALATLAGRELLFMPNTSHRDAEFYLNASNLELQLQHEEAWLRCGTCSRLYVEDLKRCCPHCQGRLEPVTAEGEVALEARAGFYRSKVLRALQGDLREPYGLRANEHTAQLSGLDSGEAHTKTELYELAFQDIPVEGQPPIDVLSCTTTMEVGIDIGQLTAVALRNVPPMVANYQQRAGRAGRRGVSIASVMTWCQGGGHDAHYFKHPAAIISGAPLPPIVYIENMEILRRHINAFLVQRFFHATVKPTPDRPALFASLGTVATFLDPAEDCSLEALGGWLEASEAQLQDELRAWAPRHSYGRGGDLEQEVEEAITRAVPALLTALHRQLPLDLYARRHHLEPEEADRLALMLEEELLQTLLNQAVLPRYAFPTDVVSFYVFKPRTHWKSPKRPEFTYQPSRDLQIALTEYAPGHPITIDGHRFVAAALYSPFGQTVARALEEARPYLSCSTCGYVRVGGERRAQLCPVCRTGEALKPQPFVLPPGFAADASAEAEIDTGGAVPFMGFATRAQLEVPPTPDWRTHLYDGRLLAVAEPNDLVVVNKGRDDAGFFVCPSCGLVEPPAGRGLTAPSRLFDKKGAAQVHRHPTRAGERCAGAPHPEAIFLGHSFRTDVLLLRLSFEAPFACAASEPAGRAALTTLAEAVGLAAARVLQIEQGEVNAWWSPVQGRDGQEALLYLYDRLAGGAGYASRLGEPATLTQVIDAAEALLTGCTCEASCYRCLQHYANQREHAILDRHLGLELLRHVTAGAIPSVSAAATHGLLQPITAWLDVQSIPWELNHAEEDDDGAPLTVPLVIHPATRPVWVAVHHALHSEDDWSNTPLGRLAVEVMQPIRHLSAWMLRHDLPSACERLRVHQETR